MGLASQPAAHYPLSMVSETLFRSDDLFVKFNRGFASDILYICFAPYSEDSALDRPGFGEDYLNGRQIDAIHVIGRDNSWYQYDGWRDILRLIREAAAPYRRVITYGSSMGGYAALRFGDQCGAHAGIAISPQFSIDHAIAPFEHRWRESGLIHFRNEESDGLAERYIVFDPHDDDARHFQLFQQTGPVTGIRTPYAGHPAGQHLVDTGAMKALLAAVEAGDVDPPALERLMRAGRRNSAQYLCTLATRLPPHHRDSAIALARMGTVALPGFEHGHHVLARMLIRAGRAEEGEQKLARLIGPHQPAPAFAHTLGTSLLDRGHLDEAWLVAHHAQARYPGHPDIMALSDAVARALPDGPTYRAIDAFGYWPAARSPLSAQSRDEERDARYLLHSAYQIDGDQPTRLLGHIQRLRDHRGGFHIAVHRLQPSGDVSQHSYAEYDFQQLADNGGWFSLSFDPAPATDQGPDLYAVYAYLLPDSDAIADDVLMVAISGTVRDTSRFRTIFPRRSSGPMSSR